MLETNIDDMSGELYTELMDQLFDAGARDVFYESIYMKKNRPAIKISVLASEALVDSIEKFLFIHSTTFGIRKYPVERSILKREFKEHMTEHGPITFKYGYYQDELLKVTPEYESVKKLSKQVNKPLKDLYMYALSYSEKEIIKKRL